MTDVHPVAKLLTPEMRERVRAATFVDREPDEFLATVYAQVDGNWACPLAVAVGVEGIVTAAWVVEVAKGIPLGEVTEQDEAIAQEFIDLVDCGQIAADDVKAVLGCEP